VSDEDDFQYEEVEVDEQEEHELEENLDTALATLKSKSSLIVPVDTNKRPETAEEFVRSFLQKVGLKKTSQIFEVCGYFALVFLPLC